MKTKNNNALRNCQLRLFCIHVTRLLAAIVVFETTKKEGGGKKMKDGGKRLEAIFIKKKKKNIESRHGTDGKSNLSSSLELPQHKSEHIKPSLGGRE